MSFSFSYFIVGILLGNLQYNLLKAFSYKNPKLNFFNWFQLIAYICIVGWVCIDILQGYPADKLNVKKSDACIVQK